MLKAQIVKYRRYIFVKCRFLYIDGMNRVTIISLVHEEEIGPALALVFTLLPYGGATII